MPGEAYGGAIQAALFDFGGVLTTPVWDSFAAFSREEGLDPDSVKAVFRTDPEALALLRRLETGSISESEFERRFGDRLGLKDHEHLIKRMFKGMKPLDSMVGAVRDLRLEGIRTGLISNSWSTSHYDRELLGSLFDAIVISAEVGLHKPEPEIYLLAAERIGVEPSTCVFVDDLRENCEGAEAVGMTAIRHVDPAQTIALLGKLTGVELDPEGG
ncbi:MAG TPA: HAD family phosphatase [Solirubrobacterales bacterium]|jgi:epoxide hydrolase-like predicted phosphatase|nr:HAD family phosphatase [Solirubrobacterales bacterium]